MHLSRKIFVFKYPAEEKHITTVIVI